MAAPVLWGSEFQVNVPSADYHSEQQVVALKNGSFVVVWTEGPSSRGSELALTEPRVKARLYGADGRPLGQEFVVAAGADRADVTVLNDGRFVVTYAAKRDPYLDVKARVYNPDGTVVGQPLDIISTAKPSLVTALADGGFSTAFVKSNEGEAVIYVRSYDRNGNSNSGTFIASLEPNEAGFRITSLTGLADGRFVLAYEELDSWGGVSRAVGRILTPGIAPSSETPNLPMPSGSGGVGYKQPHVEQLSDGRLLTAWYENSNGIKVKIDGIGREVLAVSFTADFNPSYDLIALKDGGFAIAWTKTTDADAADILVSVFSNTGERIGNDLLVNTKAAGAQWSPKLTELADGRVTVSWTDGLIYRGSESTSMEVRAQIIDPRSKAISRAGTAFDDEYIGTAFGDTLGGAAGSDHLRGEGGDDVLDGGVGADKLEGGLGNDLYYVDNAADTVIEAAGSGRDTVVTSLSYTLSAGAEVEVLRFFNASSKASISLTGSNTANEIVGNAGVNTLRGLSGNDVLKASAGNDRVYGDAGNDTIYGGAGNDKLYGGSGTGRDTFVFDTRTNKSTNVDRIYDFNAKYDTIWLDNAVFTKLGKGTLSKPVKFKADMFVKGKAAQDREDRIVYDSKSGALYYDQDGTGSKAQVKIATLSKNLKLTHSDFFII